MVDRLRLRVLLHDGEPAHSLVARLASRHGENIPRFLNAHRLDLRGLALGKSVVQLAVLASTDADLLTSNTASLTGVGQNILLRDEHLSWLDWSINPRRVCPACLFNDREDADSNGVEWVAWHRSWWDVNCILVCPIHACLLIKQCPQCCCELDWSTTSIDRCSNGHLLAKRHFDRRVDTMADQYLFQRFNQSKTGTTNRLLDQLTVGNAAKVIERLGAVAELQWSANLPSTSDLHLAAHRRSVGFSMSLDVENNFWLALDDVIACVPGLNRGVIKNYGWIYRNWLRLPGTDHSGGQLRKILLAHAAVNEITAPGERFPTTRALSLKTTSAKIGRSRAYTRRVAFSEGLVPNGSRPGVPFLIDTAKMDQIGAHVAALVDSKTSAKILGIGRRQFRMLVEVGLIVADEKAKRFGFDRAFTQTHLHNFCERLASYVPVAKCTSHSAVNLPAACRAAGVAISEVCRAIIDGTVVPVSRSSTKNGIAALMLLPQDLNALKKPRSRPVAQIAAALGIHLQAASQLIKAGGFGQPPEVSTASIAAFKVRFAKPVELAILSQRSGSSVIRQLALANCTPSFGPPHCRQLFYPRKTAKKILASSSSNEGIVA